MNLKIGQIVNVVEAKVNYAAAKKGRQYLVQTEHICGVGVYVPELLLTGGHYLSANDKEYEPAKWGLRIKTLKLK